LKSTNNTTIAGSLDPDPFCDELVEQKCPVVKPLTTMLAEIDGLDFNPDSMLIIPSKPSTPTLDSRCNLGPSVYESLPYFQDSECRLSSNDGPVNRNCPAILNSKIAVSKKNLSLFDDTMPRFTTIGGGLDPDPFSEAWQIDVAKIQPYTCDKQRQSALQTQVALSLNIRIVRRALGRYFILWQRLITHRHKTTQVDTNQQSLAPNGDETRQGIWPWSSLYASLRKLMFKAQNVHFTVEQSTVGTLEGNHRERPRPGPSRFPLDVDLSLYSDSTGIDDPSDPAYEVTSINDYLEHRILHSRGASLKSITHEMRDEKEACSCSSNTCHLLQSVSVDQ
jgi:hypothetical protein